MTEASETLPFFIPATTEGEAISRIFALTGRSNRGTRGAKRALVALRDALSLDVDITATNAMTARRLADQLNVQWAPGQMEHKSGVTLAGLNALLEGSVEAQWAGHLTRLRDDVPASLDGPEWSAFEPARSKIEAVTRIAGLTHAPREWLGPGGKEHKSLLVNLADRALPGVGLDRSSKTRFAADLCRQFRVPWTDDCYSTGETISLIGLNTLLAGAERYLGLLGTTLTDQLESPAAEGDALSAALLQGLPRVWDGREAVMWLQANSLRGAFDNEWQGFYGEERAKEVLGRSFTPSLKPPQVKYGRTTFDYALNWVWDIKVHTARSISGTGVQEKRGSIVLNDSNAVRACVSKGGGLGFLIINGDAVMDDTGEFVAWQREKKAQAGRSVSRSNSGRSRTRKKAFMPTAVEAFHLGSAEALSAAFLSGAVVERSQGRQAPRDDQVEGAARAPKVHLSPAEARLSLLIAEYSFKASSRSE